MHSIAASHAMPVSYPGGRRYKTKSLRIKWIILLIVTSIQVGVLRAQVITLSYKNSPLETVLKSVERQSGYQFFYNESMMQKTNPVSIDVKNYQLVNVLKLCFFKQPLSFAIVGKTVVVTEDQAAAALKSQTVPVEGDKTTRVVITGKITDGDGKPLSSATVIVNNPVNQARTQQPAATVSDDNGMYSIQAAADAKITFSRIGYLSQEEPVLNRTVIDIVLEQSVNQMDDIVVVGYGTQLQREITNSIVKVKGEDIQNIPVASPEALLQGRAAGVDVIQNSGQPGAGVTVRIRGNTSINAGNTPLYVIDGVPINSDNLSDANRGNEINPLADINASDIESMEVLKDASAAAIYGSRAANGVILITTKRGKAGVASYSVNVYRGWQKIARYLPKLSVGEFIEWTQDNRANQGLPAYSFPLLLNDSVNTNWLKEITQIAPSLNVDASVRGGSANLRYALSANVYDQEGIVKSTKFQRISTRFNLDYNAGKRFSIGNSITISRTNNLRAVGDNNGDAIIGYALRKAPSVPIYNPDGSYFLNDPIYTGNPVAYANEQKYTTQSTRLVGNIYGEYKILPNLKLRVLAGADFSLVQDDYFRPSTVVLAGTTLGAAGTSSLSTWINENTITYNTRIKKDHNISLLGGFSQQESERKSVRANVTGYGSNAIPTINGGSIISVATSDIQRNGLTSYFARGNYSYRSKYLLQLSGRYDGSSRFGPDNRFAFFPAVSVGWRIAEENFFKKVSFLNELKLRASMGTNGNQNGIPNYTSQGTFSTGLNYGGITGIAQTALSNSGLKWEKTTQYNAGVDIGLLRNRIEITADAYIKKTSDLLLNRVLPGSSGYNTVLSNVGNTENRGVEFSVTTKNVTGRFNWSSSFNISFNKNKIISLAEDQKEILFSRTTLAPPAYLKVGDAIGSFYGWDFLGVLPTNDDNKTGLTNSGTYVYKGGDAFYRDVNGDNKISDADIVKIGDANPEFFGGFINKFDYNGIDLSIFLQYSYGGDIYNITGQNQRDNVRLRNRWRKPGDITDVPRNSSTDQAKISRRFLEDGSYLKIRNVTLGYNFPKDLLQKVHLKSARLYVSGQNLVTFTEYSGFDPEVNSVSTAVINIGIDYFTYPQVRTYLVGLNIGF